MDRLTDTEPGLDEHRSNRDEPVGDGLLRLALVNRPRAIDLVAEVQSRSPGPHLFHGVGIEQEGQQTGAAGAEHAGRFVEVVLGVAAGQVREQRGGEDKVK